MSNEVSTVVPTAEKKSNVLYLIELYVDKWIRHAGFTTLEEAHEYVREIRKSPTFVPLRIVKRTAIEEVVE